MTSKEKIQGPNKQHSFEPFIMCLDFNSEFLSVIMN